MMYSDTPHALRLSVAAGYAHSPPRRRPPRSGGENGSWVKASKTEAPQNARPRPRCAYHRRAIVAPLGPKAPGRPRTPVATGVCMFGVMFGLMSIGSSRVSRHRDAREEICALEKNGVFE